MEQREIDIEFNATMGQLYQIVNHYREHLGVIVYFYNVRVTNRGVLCTASPDDAAILNVIMSSKGYEKLL